MNDETIRDWWEELFQIHEFAQYQEYADDLTRREIDFIVTALSLRGTETILDLACGGGRHTLELSRRGFTVEGLDASQRIIEHARERALVEQLTARFTIGDMRALTYKGVFDTALVMNSSIGFFDDEVNQAVIAGLGRALAPGGRLLLQCINPYQIEAYLREFRSGWYQLGEGYVLRQATFEPLNARLSIDYRYLDVQRGMNIAHPGDRIRLYGFPELRALLARAGLRAHTIFGDAVLPPVPFGESSLWQVVVAVKDQPLSPEN